MLACKKGKPNVVGAIIKMLHLPDGCGTLKCLYNQKVKEGEEKGMNCLDLAIVHGHRYVCTCILIQVLICKILDSLLQYYKVYYIILHEYKWVCKKELSLLFAKSLIASFSGRWLKWSSWVKTPARKTAGKKVWGIPPLGKTALRLHLSGGSSEKCLVHVQYLY